LGEKLGFREPSGYGYFRNIKQRAVFIEELVVRKAGFLKFSKCFKN
jgi:hypothetical protein